MCLTTFGRRSRPCGLAEPPRPKGGRPRCEDRAALVGLVFGARAWASPGRCFRASWAVWACPAGGGCATGKGPACGPGFTACCLSAVRVPGIRTGAGLRLPAARQQHDSSTVAVRGAPRPGRTQRIAGQTGPDAPPRGRPPGHPLRRAPEPGRPARQPPAGAHPRRRARCPSRPGPSQDAPQQASRRQGLRSPSRPRGVPGPLRHAASRRASPDAGPTAATASVGTAGWWSARAPGSAASGVWRSASRPATSGAANIHGAFALLGCALPCLTQIRRLV